MTNPIIIPAHTKELLAGTRRLLAARHALAFLEQFATKLRDRPELATLSISVHRDEHGLTIRAVPQPPR